MDVATPGDHAAFDGGDAGLDVGQQRGLDGLGGAVMASRQLPRAKASW
jgi:phosphoribosylformylglycinamidine (FGAM) synthase-like enzyme